MLCWVTRIGKDCKDEMNRADLKLKISQDQRQRDMWAIDQFGWFLKMLKTISFGTISLWSTAIKPDHLLLIDVKVAIIALKTKEFLNALSPIACDRLLVSTYAIFCLNSCKFHFAVRCLGAFSEFWVPRVRTFRQTTTLTQAVARSCATTRTAPTTITFSDIRPHPSVLSLEESSDASFFL